MSARTFLKGWTLAVGAAGGEMHSELTAGMGVWTASVEKRAAAAGGEEYGRAVRGMAERMVTDAKALSSGNPAGRR